MIVNNHPEVRMSNTTQMAQKQTMTLYSNCFDLLSSFVQVHD